MRAQALHSRKKSIPGSSGKNRPVRNFLDFLTPTVAPKPAPVSDPTSLSSANSVRLYQTKPELVTTPDEVGDRDDTIQLNPFSQPEIHKSFHTATNISLD